MGHEQRVTLSVLDGTGDDVVTVKSATQGGLEPPYFACALPRRQKTGNALSIRPLGLYFLMPACPPTPCVLATAQFCWLAATITFHSSSFLVLRGWFGENRFQAALVTSKPP